jgi:hypothetical protein
MGKITAIGLKLFFYGEALEIKYQALIKSCESFGRKSAGRPM